MCEPKEVFENRYDFEKLFSDDTVDERFWDVDSRNKALEFTQHYASYQYCIIDYDMYHSICKKYAPLIPKWEEPFQSLNREEIVSVVGIGYGTRPQTVKSLTLQQNLILKRDKSNEFDKNAILVMTESGHEVGFISSDWSCIYAPKIDLGMTFSAKVKTIEEKKIGIEVKRTNPEEIILWDFLR